MVKNEGVLVVWDATNGRFHRVVTTVIGKIPDRLIVSFQLMQDRCQPLLRFSIQLYLNGDLNALIQHFPIYQVLFSVVFSGLVNVSFTHPFVLLATKSFGVSSRTRLVKMNANIEVN